MSEDVVIGGGVYGVLVASVLARRGRRMAHPHLAGLAVGHLGARFVHHAHLQAGLGAAKFLAAVSGSARK